MKQKQITQCQDCKFLGEKHPQNNALYKCHQGGWRQRSFPSCYLFSPKEHQHNDDINMFTKTDVRDDS